MEGALKDNLFQKILDKQIPAKIAYEDDLCLAFHDINPQAPTHVLIIPRKAIVTHADLTEQDGALLGHMHLVAMKLAKQFKLDDGTDASIAWIAADRRCRIVLAPAGGDAGCRGEAYEMQYEERSNEELIPKGRAPPPGDWRYVASTVDWRAATLRTEGKLLRAA